MYVMFFNCIQKHDEILKSGRKKYILFINIYIYILKKLFTLLKIKISYTGIRARNLVCETLIFNNLSAYLFYLLLIDLV